MKKIKVVVLVLSLLLSCVYAECGWCMTTTATSQSIMMPIQTWNELKSELQALNGDLIQSKTELSKLKKPSQELVNELTQAQSLLEKLQVELELQKSDLSLLSKEAEELRTSSKRLSEQINKERKVHHRQVWQNRMWCLLIGTGIGVLIR